MKKEEYLRILKNYLSKNNKLREYYRNKKFIDDNYLKLKKECDLAEKAYMKLFRVEQLID